METYFSKNAGVLLKQRNLTQQEFCEKLGVGKSNWSNVVNANKLDMLAKIAQVLEMDLEDVIGLKKPKFILSGFVKLQDEIYEIQSRADLEKVLSAIDIIETANE